jgi:hypothetical protein
VHIQVIIIYINLLDIKHRKRGKSGFATSFERTISPRKDIRDIELSEYPIFLEKKRSDYEETPKQTNIKHTRSIDKRLKFIPDK